MVKFGVADFHIDSKFWDFIPVSNYSEENNEYETVENLNPERIVEILYTFSVGY